MSATDKRLAALNYGEINKHASVLSHMNTVREFLEWLDGRQIELGSREFHGERLLPHHEDREAMLNRFFEIDTVKLENERRALLESCK